MRPRIFQIVGGNLHQQILGDIEKWCISELLAKFQHFCGFLLYLAKYAIYGHATLGPKSF